MPETGEEPEGDYAADYEAFDGSQMFDEYSSYYDMRAGRGPDDSGPIKRARKRYPIGKPVGLPRKGPPTILKRLSANSSEGVPAPQPQTVRPPPFTSINNKVVINNVPRAQNTQKISAKTQMVTNQPVVKLLSSTNNPVVIKTDIGPIMENPSPVEADAENESGHGPVIISAGSAVRTVIPMLSRAPVRSNVGEPTASELLFGKRATPQSTSAQYSYVPSALPPKFTVASPFGMNLIANQHKKVVLLPSLANGGGGSGAPRVLAVNSVKEPGPGAHNS
ncbi:hypothetical protein Ciccas_005363 [Cichlidogyrus casuarinus]|uniref:Uncharacterized protein n=1 Tax=Cichlidogyrus casuarinus TaxID=1844966 RepID=A0ABD2Q932_9PLAT